MSISVARLTAVKLLSKLFGGELPDVESKVASLIEDKRDAELCLKIILGTVEKNEELAERINAVSKTPVSKMRPILAANVKAAVYQLLYLERIPEFAAVNEAVEITKKLVSPSLSGFTNAVIRNTVRNKDNYIPKTDAAKYCLPDWITKSFTENYGKENAEKILNGFSQKTADIIRINNIKTDSKALKEVYGNRITLIDESSAEFIFEGDVTVDENFKNGYFHFQNCSSQFCVSVLAPRENDTVLDACASPGGKSFTAAELMGNIGEIDSVDVNEKKIKKIEDGAKRLGITIIKPTVADSTEFSSGKKYDKILCDVPCSGLGQLRKKPYFKLKNEKDLSELPKIQYQILKNCAKMLKNGGTLVYSTCTLRSAENEEIINRFVENNDFEIAPIKPTFENAICKNGTVTVIPNGKFEGFFVTKLIKKG